LASVRWFREGLQSIITKDERIEVIEMLPMAMKPLYALNGHMIGDRLST